MHIRITVYIIEVVYIKEATIVQIFEFSLNSFQGHHYTLLSRIYKIVLSTKNMHFINPSCDTELDF